jgi:hypothetical protein
LTETIGTASVTLIRENEDGSADYQFNFPPEALEALTRLGILTAIQALDSLADQIVTAVGVGVCAKMDMNAAVTEVNESNWSKFNYKGYPEFDEHGKIKKGERYRKPALKGMF